MSMMNYLRNGLSESDVQEYLAIFDEFAPTEPSNVGLEYLQEPPITNKVSTVQRTKDTVELNDSKWGDVTARLNNYGLAGCLSVLIYTSENGGNRQGILTHYDPLSILVHGRKLDELIALHSSMKEATKKEAVIFYPERAQDRQKDLDYLELVLKVGLGEDTNVQREEYSVMDCDPGFRGIIYPVGDARYITRITARGGEKFE